MTIPTSHLSYTDCYDTMDRALEDEQGVRVKFRTFGEATFFRMRCHQARAINRRMNKELHEVGHPMHGGSIYDRLILRIRESGAVAYVYIEKMTNIMGDIESLADVWEELPAPQKAIASAKPLQIEHVKRRV